MRKSILIVEGSRALQFLITTILRDKYLVQCVQNSVQAMQLFESGYEANLVILDVPGIESENIELLEHISTSSIFSNTTAIVLTAAKSEELKNVCLEIGASDVLNKPFDPVYLSERADQLLSQNSPDIIPRKRKIFNNMNLF